MLTRNGPRPPADTYRSWRAVTGIVVFWVLLDFSLAFYA